MIHYYKAILNQTPRNIVDNVQFVISLFCLNYKLLLDYDSKNYESMICDIAQFIRDSHPRFLDYIEKADKYSLEINDEIKECIKSYLL